MLAQQPGAEPFDILIRNGRVLDGSGNPWFRADIGIRGDRIVAVGALDNARAATVADAADRFVSPGFIDVHSHSGPGLLTDALKHGQPILAQGITTVLVNPDGGGPVALAEQRASYEKQGIGPNAGLFVPHGSIRQQVMGMSDRDPDASELAKMVELARQGMEAGGLGLSSGLYYAPGSYSKTAEVVALRQSHRAVRRRVLQPHSRRGRLLDWRGRRSRRGDHHRRAGRHRRGRVAHEGPRTLELGPVQDARRAHRIGAGARRAGVRRSISRTKPAGPASWAR